MVMPSLAHHDKLGAEDTPFLAAHSLKEAVAWRGIRVQFEVIPNPDGKALGRPPISRQMPDAKSRALQNLTHRAELQWLACRPIISSDCRLAQA